MGHEMYVEETSIGKHHVEESASVQVGIDVGEELVASTSPANMCLFVFIMIYLFIVYSFFI